MNQYWIVDEVGNHGLVTGAAERDKWLREGWAQAEEPTGGSVYIWLEGVEQPGRVPVDTYRSLWSLRGWVAGPPPGGTHPAQAPPAQEPSVAAEETPPKKSAAGGRSKDEE